jgi:hypothetical protein
MKSFDNVNKNKYNNMLYDCATWIGEVCAGLSGSQL